MNVTGVAEASALAILMSSAAVVLAAVLLRGHPVFSTIFGIALGIPVGVAATFYGISSFVMTEDSAVGGMVVFPVLAMIVGVVLLWTVIASLSATAILNQPARILVDPDSDLFGADWSSASRD